MNIMSRKAVYLENLIVVLIIAGIIGCRNDAIPIPSKMPSTSSSVPAYSRAVPVNPSNLTGHAVSMTEIVIGWKDNSDNEQGFKIYRDGYATGQVGPNITTYKDTKLNFATTYTYNVVAYNDSGQSNPKPPYVVKTLNPPISVTLDKIGVINDHDPLLKGAGEIYLYLAVADGKNAPQIIRVPSSGTISLNDNESKDVHQQIFSTDCIGDELKIVAVAFESDDPLVGALGTMLMNAFIAYMGQTGDLMGNLINIMLNSQPTNDDSSPQEFSGESTSDDFVGAIKKDFAVGDKWGIGSHVDIRNGDLLLWFTVSANLENPSVSYPQTILPPISTPQNTPAPVTTYPITPVPTPVPVIIPTPILKNLPFSVEFNGWYINGIKVTTAKKGNPTIARITLSGGNSGQYTIRIRRGVNGLPDQTITSLSFQYDGFSSIKELQFIAAYATGESYTEGYHIDVMKDGVNIWTMSNSYPPRLKVSVQ